MSTFPHQIRLIGGQWKRTRLGVPGMPGLRPTPDRVRETLFNWLGQDLAGWRALDAFAGTGALGLEAASRGAQSVLLVEQDARLAAALRQSVGLPYGCQEGACGACKCKVTYGQVALGEHLESALSADEAAQGYTLTCRARALGHVVLECDQVTLASLYPPRKMPVRVAELERLAPDVMRVRLQLPANQPTPWRAGQFMEFTLPDGSRHSYSMASAPQEAEDEAPGPKRGARYVDLHIRHLPGGKFTDQVFGGGLKVKDILHAESPLGSFFLREDSQKPIVLLASGTGFAPIKAIIEHMQRHAIARPAALYWGGRRPSARPVHARMGAGTASSHARPALRACHLRRPARRRLAGPHRLRA